MKAKITSEYFDKGNRDFAIVFINNTILEAEEHFEGIKEYLLNKYKIDDTERIDKIIDNKDNKIQLKNYAMASKKDNKLVILYESIENITVSNLYKKLQVKYPNYEIYFNSEWYKAAELKEIIS